MMHRKIMIKYAMPAFIVIAIIVAASFAQNNDYVKIDEWSSGLAEEKIEWAEVAKGYGTEKHSYELSTDEYGELISLLGTVTEDVSSRKRPADISMNDYFLALRYDQMLWLFQCLDSRIISLTFEDTKTAAHYGCENSSLYINNPELWEYIINTVDSKV